MNAVISLCHFCEQHGPRIVYTTQSVRRNHDEPSPSDERRFYGNYDNLLAGIDTMQTTVDDRRCEACTSSESLYPCHLSNDHLAKTSYIGSQWPYSHQVGLIDWLIDWLIDQSPSRSTQCSPTRASDRWAARRATTALQRYSAIVSTAMWLVMRFNLLIGMPEGTSEWDWFIDWSNSLKKSLLDCDSGDRSNTTNE